MNDQSPCYMAFLLRLWCVDVEDGIAWRASLQDPHTGQRIGFADLRRLFAFLIEQTGDDLREARSEQIEAGQAASCE